MLDAGPVDALGDADRARAARQRRAADRDDVLAARLLARRAVAELTGAAPDGFTFRQRCPVCGAPHGRPEVTGAPAHVSWAHSRGWVAAIAGPAPVAVDVESLAPLTGDDLPLAPLSGPERVWLADQPDRRRAFAGLWVRKEALVKIGAASLDDLADVDVLPSLAGRPVRGHRLHGSDAGPAVSAWVSAPR